MQTNIEERVRTILAEQFCVEAGEIDLAANLEDAYTSDSLDLLEVTMTVEDEFGIEIPDETMWAMKTGQQIVDYVTAAVSEKATAA